MVAPKENIQFALNTLHPGVEPGNETGIGGEVNNYRVKAGKVFGVVQNTNKAPVLNLHRIDPSASEKLLNNVLLVFFAKDPRPESKGQVVIGWHKNATVSSAYKMSPWWHYAVSAAKNAVLLPTNRRTCVVPRGKNAPGQSNVFFLFDSAGNYRKFKWVDDILDFIDSYSGPNLVTQPEAEAHPEIEATIENELATAIAQGIQINPAARKAIENVAMNSAKKHFEQKGFTVQNVSSSRSYDLHCTKKGKELFVEVKGSQLPVSKIILTPNEVLFAKKNAKCMVLYILHSIKVRFNRKKYRASGGVQKIVSPWTIQTNRLSPVQYFYEVAS